MSSPRVSLADTLALHPGFDDPKLYLGRSTYNGKFWGYVILRRI